MFNKITTNLIAAGANVNNQLDLNYSGGLKYMKYYSIISLLFIGLQFASCHKKHNAPTPSWEQVSSQGNFINNQKVVVYNNELILYDNTYNTLYRYDINAKLIEKKILPGKTVQLYAGFYTVDSLQSNTGFGYHNDSLTVNSYTTSGNRYPLDLRSYLTTSSDTYTSVLIPSLDATLSATINFENITTSKIFLAIYQPDTSNGQINGITNITNINLPGNFPYDYYGKNFGYKGNYIFSTGNDATYLLKSNGSYNLTLQGDVTPLFVYQDSLYALNPFNSALNSFNNLYSTYDGTSWNLKTGTLNSSISIPITNINNRLLGSHSSGDLLEYHLASNTVSSLPGNGLGQVNGYVLLGDYVYAYGVGIYRIKYSDLFQ